MRLCLSLTPILALCLSLGPGVSAWPEFKVDFARQPAVVRFNTFYNRFELLLELIITKVDRSLNQVVTELNVKTEKAMSSGYFGAIVLARVSSSGTGGQLVFQCASLARCCQMKAKIDASPSFIQQAVEFAPVGLYDGIAAQFRAVRSAEPPASAPAFLDTGDVLFQRHGDNRLSFIQNWDTYVSGFGHPGDDFWMGLEQLSALTKDRNCKWTVEVTFFNGSVLSATYTDFQVRGADENYRLRVGAKESGSLHIYNLQYHDNMQFSTFDRDNDGYSSRHCSKDYAGNSGWWFGACYKFNPNGRIISESDWRTKCEWVSWSQLEDGHTNFCIKRSQLSFRCA